ncbi:DUF2500 domain-containing protein [Streptomyces sp. NBC_01474]|uniref:hypothetical protein n=1 Tax=Streptomyces sp. NBC_01474 TaxID=2903880 RepID=UPI002DDA8458|nr:hypothetical protein [Streptomyces sp. NBC_01474]WSD96722.1 DUF2500 domain-containing protein [Streptomyces sp. NBC_01474]
MNRRTYAALAMTAGAVALLAGCSLPDGPAGVVVAKAERTPPASATRPYFLTVRTADGDRKDFQVYIDDYDRCSIGERYPQCKETRA